MVNAFASMTKLIEAEMYLLGDSHAKINESQLAQIANFRSILTAKKDINVDEAGEILNKLSEPSIAFTDEHRREMAAAVTAVARNATCENLTKTQTHNFMCNYLTETQWTKLLKEGTTWTACIEVLAQAAVDIGMTCPRELTITQMIALIQCAKRVELEPNQSYARGEDLKLLIKAKTKNQRKIKFEDMKVYPEDVSDFINIYPDAFSINDPPVPSRIDANQVAERAMLSPTRKSSRKLTIKSSGSQSSCPTAPLISAMAAMDNPQAMMGAMCQFIMSGMQQSGGIPGLTILPTRPGLPNAGQSLASPQLSLADQAKMYAIKDMEDAGAADEAACEAAGDVQPPTQVAPTGFAAIADVSNSVREALNRQSRARAEKSKKTQPDQDGQDGTESKAKKAKIAAIETATDASASISLPPFKRPAAYVQPPSTSQAASCNGRPLPTTSPTAYGGGKIYYSKPKNRFRVYTCVGDRIEKHVKVDTMDMNSMNEAWASACSLIENDPRNK